MKKIIIIFILLINVQIMKISKVIEQLNAALEQYGDIPVTMAVLGENNLNADIRDIQTDDTSVTLYDF